MKRKDCKRIRHSIAGACISIGRDEFKPSIDWSSLFFVPKEHTSSFEILRYFVWPSIQQIYKQQSTKW